MNFSKDLLYLARKFIRFIFDVYLCSYVHVGKLQVIIIVCSFLSHSFQRDDISVCKNFLMVTSTTRQKTVNRTMFHLPSSSSTLWVLIIFLSTLSTCLANNNNTNSSVQNVRTVHKPRIPPIRYCVSKRVPIEIPYEGCNSTIKELKICTGICGSQTKITASPPYSKQICQCCSSSSHRVKVRRYMFDCNGVMEEKKLYVPIVSKCSCNNCGATFGR